MSFVRVRSGSVRSTSVSSGMPSTASAYPISRRRRDSAAGTDVPVSLSVVNTGPAPIEHLVITDSAGNVVTGHTQGVNINAPDGTFLSSVGAYFDANGENQTARVQWPTRVVDVPREYGQSRVGTIDNGWVVPSVRTMKIDPIDTRADNRVNEIFVMNGVTTDISFMDGSKNPWPVEEIVFPPGIIAVNGPCVPQQAGLASVSNNESGTIYLTACMDARATVGVRLKGRAGAISLLTVPARQGEVQPDGTLSVTVAGMSPVAPAPTVTNAAAPGRPSSASGYGIGYLHDRYLDDFLMATPPQGSRRANIMGGDGSAEGWFFDGALYVRGSFTVVNPANDAQASSGDGTVNVYKYGPPVSRILAQDLGGREFVLNID